MRTNTAQIYDELSVKHTVHRLKQVGYPQYVVGFTDGSELTFGTYLKTGQHFCFVCNGNKLYSEAANANKTFIPGY